ncbi:MAG: hypothetical protein JGK08_04665 [Microcoleus sp. PH2017_04_SCI_O_A]|nr:hypothetical protein [Microcoleus sp. PH2017_04_SCI_O_A]
MKASPFEGEIKIRLFIAPILFLLGRGRSQTVNCQLSTVVCIAAVSTAVCSLYSNIF